MRIQPPDTGRFEKLADQWEKETAPFLQLQ